MDLETLQQRLKRYPEAKLVYGIQPNEVSRIEYQGVILTNNRYGPLWDLFRRYNEDRLRERDYQNIEILDEVPELISEVSEAVIEADTSDKNKELKRDLEQNIGRMIQINYKLYKEHTTSVKGTLRNVDDKTIYISVSGVMKYVGYDSIINYTFISRHR